jgi:hypothetical protein
MTQTCEQCGATMGAGDAFCGECGHGAAASAVAVAAPTQVDLLGSPATQVTGVQLPDSDGKATHPASQSATPGMTLDAALGEATPNATYLGQRLLYATTPETPFDPISNNRILFQMARQWLLYWAVWWVGGFLSAIFCAFVGLAGGFGLGITLWVVGGGITGLVLACLYWLLPHPALLSEWKFSVDDHGAAAPIVFDHIAWALGRRGTPLDSLQVRRLRLAGEGPRDYLELRRGLFLGYVGCFSNGSDLYVGWTFWVRLSPVRLLGMIIARIWQALTRRGTDIYTTLRYDGARAMREAMHSTTREGIDVAVGQIPPQGQGIIGSSIAVTEVGA